MTAVSPGRLIGIARKAYRLARVETIDAVRISREAGVQGDHRGAKFPKRQVTILAREDWQDALNDLAGPAGPPELPWTLRRANLFVEGVRLPRAKGAIIAVGPVVFEVTDETNPCGRMEEAYPGLLTALTPAWRGGVCCRVVEPGDLVLGAEVIIRSSPPEKLRTQLPG